ncbi:hypothetical protein BCV35_014020 [Vibrio cyclitrophicus]|uniref:capsular polysaccharide export protein, LipB/KpsS family n=1 Tax=Vibrio cyclitrophicus TaxID=47951 RepID=UPI000CC0594C|nr:hypothetical protein [Vibrio cyclitrophicus]PME46475.1 hypothetical protein BCV35_16425 [Vibrio cyclitrophicus]
MKNLYVMCFYESNVRYFYEAISYFKNKNINLIFLCMYPSAVKFCVINKLDYIHLPKEVRKKNIESLDNILTEKEAYNCYYFHQSLLPFNNDEYVDVVNRYYRFYDELFQSDDCLGAVVIGDVRLYSSTAKLSSNKHNKKVVYFEPGPFGTMIFDDRGVNKNMAISLLSKDDITSYKSDKNSLNDFYKVSHSKKYYSGSALAYLRKIPDVISSIPPQVLRRFFPIELQTGESFYESIPYLISRLNIVKNKKTIPKKHNGKYIFFPLQVPCDVQIVMNSPHFNSIFHMVKELSEHVPDDYKLIIREHPMNLDRYGSEFYSYIRNHDNIILDNSNDIWELVQSSDLVVVNNSTVGIEALRYDTEVLVLGDAFYHKAVHVFNGIDLGSAIKDAINNPISREFKDKYLSLLYREFLIKDNYKNIKYNNLDLMVDKISDFYA